MKRLCRSLFQDISRSKRNKLIFVVSSRLLNSARPRIDQVVSLSCSSSYLFSLEQQQTSGLLRDLQSWKLTYRVRYNERRYSQGTAIGNAKESIQFTMGDFASESTDEAEDQERIDSSDSKEDDEEEVLTAELDAWRQVHTLLRRSVEKARIAVDQKKAERRYWMEELAFNLSETTGGKLDPHSSWKRPTAVKFPKSGGTAPGGKRKKKETTTSASTTNSQSPEKPPAKKPRIKKKKEDIVPSKRSSPSAGAVKSRPIPSAPQEDYYEDEDDEEDDDDDEQFHNHVAAAHSDISTSSFLPSAASSWRPTPQEPASALHMMVS